MTDEQEIGGVIDEMYAMISGPAGPRDWSRQPNCFLPKARQVRTSVDSEGRAQMLSMSLDDYAANTTAFFMANAFYEVETSRRIDLFGNIAHVWSAYEGAHFARRCKHRPAGKQFNSAVPPRRTRLADHPYDLG